MREVNLPIRSDSGLPAELTCGERVLLSGRLFTARDAAHSRLCGLISSGMELPADFTGAGIYYTGPSPAPPGRVVGSAGPTTSCRMDRYAPVILDNTGVRMIIGKGMVGEEVVEALKRNRACYLAATGGAGALISECVVSSRIVAYEDLGPEAVREFEVKNLPLITAVDSSGCSLYEKGKAEFRGD